MGERGCGLCCQKEGDFSFFMSPSKASDPLEVVKETDLFYVEQMALQAVVGQEHNLGEISPLRASLS